MAESIIVISVILIFLLILIQDISIRFLYENEFSAELDYSFFTVILTDFKRQNKLSGLNQDILKKRKKVIEFLLSHSKLEICEIKIPSNEDDPKKFSLQYKNLFSLFAAFTVYLSNKTKKLLISDSAIRIESSPEEAERFIFDVKLTTSLYAALLYATMLFLTKQKRKRAIKSK